MRPLIWFRSDLRVADNPALYAASRAAERGAVAVFVFCPRQWREKHDWGDVKVDFLRRNLEVLSRDLEKLAIALLFVQAPDFAGVPAKLLALARRHGCDALFFNRELEVYERRRDAEVEAAFTAAGRAVHVFDDQTVLPPQEVQKRGGGFFSIFTPFHRAWKQRLLADGPPRLVGRPRRQPELVCPPDPLPARLAGWAPSGIDPKLWPAGSRAALGHLERFLGGPAQRYLDDRDVPSLPATSQLSAALALGVVSPRQCLAAALAANHGELEAGDPGELEAGDPGIAGWMRQLAWRDFYRHVLVGFPRVSMGRPFQLATEKVLWRDDEPALRAWEEGRTGVPIVDAGMRQLLETGWMHNRLRMIVAMFLTKDLLIDWRRGERWFMRHLVDGDLANNNGGWQWAASTGTDAAPYFRILNPWTQSRRFDPEGRFIRRFVPELARVPAAALHDPKALAPLRRGLDYPPPIVDHASARERAIGAFRGL